jgi:NhaA family Na+:H+ antiporter
MLEDMAHALHPWVIFGIMPLFAFANAGVSFEGIRLPNLGDPLPLGIIAGLFIGKQIGVFGLLALSIRTGVCALPQGVTWRHLYGISLLCGIGFTMSLFIGSLAFPSGAQDSMVRLGVLCGSLLSSVAGYMVLKAAITK